jgi:tRNA pseudouridine38-40 synthase
MPRIAVGVEYDGLRLAGWQSQRDLPTVQGSLEQALSRVADAPVAIVGAGRTDAGVHARGQVAHFDTDARRTARSWVLGANTHLPPGIALRWAMEVPEHFHARYSALSRSYRYIILNRSSRPGLASSRVAFFHRPLDVERMQAAVPHLLGEHDFSAFRSSECQANSPVRNLMALRVQRVGEFIGLEVRANAFLHHMVRNLAGLLAAIGQGEREPDWAAEILASRDRRLNAATAPAEGLYFWSARYPDGFGLPDDSDMMHGPAGCPADLMG